MQRVSTVDITAVETFCFSNPGDTNLRVVDGQRLHHHLVV